MRGRAFDTTKANMPFHLQLIKLVGTFLLNFDVQIQGEKHPEIPSSKSYFFARMRDPIMATVKERQ